MSDWSKPTLASTYTNFVPEVGGRLDDAAKMNRTGGGTVPSVVTLTNPPVGTVRFNSGTSIWESNTGTGATAAVPVWEPLAATYGITVSKASQWATTRTIGITGDAAATAVNIDGTGNISLATTLATVNANTGVVGSATAVPVLTLDGKGRITAASTAALGTMAAQASGSVSITGGAVSGTSLTLVQSTTAAPTAEGRMEWDTDGDTLMIGTGAATKTFAPINPTAAVTVTSYAMSTGCTWGGTAIPVANGGTGATDAPTARTNLGIGSMAAQSASSVALTGGTISGTTITLVQSTTAAPTAEGVIEWDTDNDLLVIGNGTAAKTFAPLSPQSQVTAVSYTFSTDCNWNGNAVPVLYGGTGATTAAVALTNLGAAPLASPTFTGTVSGITKAMVGLGNVDNTADSTKSVSYAATAGSAPANGGTSAACSGTANRALGLLRSDSAADGYNVQSWWDGTRWELKGYNGTTFHAGVRVNYADTAGSAPASDVSAWAKAASKPSYTAAEVGLGNVNNTADSAKSVSYAATAGSAPASDVYAWAKAATKPSYTASEVGLGNVNNTADATKSVSYAATAGSAPANGGTSAACSGAAASANALNTVNSYQVNSLGVGTPASGTAGEIRATNNVTSYYTSDRRLKKNIKLIPAALAMVNKLRGVYFDWKDSVVKKRGGEDGYFVRKHDAGVIAQEIEAVFPEAVATNGEGFKAVRYELLVPLLINAINELHLEVQQLKSKA